MAKAIAFVLLLLSPGMVYAAAANGETSGGSRPSAPPAVSVTAPVGGEEWCMDSSYNITWSASDDTLITNIALYYSTDGGTGWINISGTEENDGTYPWTIPGTPSTQCLVKVVAFDATDSTADSSDANFTIKDCQAPTVDVTSPVGGEEWCIDSSYNITWSASDNIVVTNIALYYSTDGGSAWTPIDETEPNDGTYSWIIPGVPSTQCRVKVIASDETGNFAADSSDANFTIRDCQAPTVDVTSPVGGEEWCIDSSYNITWSASDNIGVTNIALYYSTDGGSGWTPISETESNDGT
jgi:hypothetical protein